MASDINKVCMRLRDIWSKWPELRFGQFLYNVIGYYMSQSDKDIFYVEDNVLLNIFEEYMNENSPWYRPGD